MIQSLFGSVLLLTLILGFFIEGAALEAAPWKRETDRGVAPWLRDGRDSERKNLREQFFANLNLPFSQESSSARKKESSSSQARSQSESKAKESERGGSERDSQILRSRSSSTEEIDSVPWKRYEDEWTRPIQTPFAWPVDRGRMTSGYGPRRGGFHEGLDIGGVEGQPIRVIHEGRVVFVGTLRGYGQTVVVYHGQGLSSVYAHNRENLVQDGQRVQKGQVIATLGSTGTSSGPHLHLEIRRDGKPLNPLSYEFDRQSFIQAGFGR